MLYNNQLKELNGLTRWSACRDTISNNQTHQLQLKSVHKPAFFKHTTTNARCVQRQDELQNSDNDFQNVKKIRKLHYVDH